MFELIGKNPRSTICPAIDGISDEGEAILQDFTDTSALDAGLSAAAQAVEHYEIAHYGTLRQWAERLGHMDAAKLLGQTLNEESQTDGALTQIATSEANKTASAA